MTQRSGEGATGSVDGTRVVSAIRARHHARSEALGGLSFTAARSRTDTRSQRKDSDACPSQARDSLCARGGYPVCSGVCATQRPARSPRSGVSRVWPGHSALAAHTAANSPQPVAPAHVWRHCRAYRSISATTERSQRVSGSPCPNNLTQPDTHRARMSTLTRRPWSSSPRQAGPVDAAVTGGTGRRQFARRRSPRPLEPPRLRRADALADDPPVAVARASRAQDAPVRATVVTGLR